MECENNWFYLPILFNYNNIYLLIMDIYPI